MIEHLGHFSSPVSWVKIDKVRNITCFCLQGRIFSLGSNHGNTCRHSSWTFVRSSVGSTWWLYLFHILIDLLWNSLDFPNSTAVQTFSLYKLLKSKLKYVFQNKCMYVMYVCDVCVWCMYVMYVCDVCMWCMYVMYVCDVCMWCMYVICV